MKTLVPVSVLAIIGGALLCLVTGCDPSIQNSAMPNGMSDLRYVPRTFDGCQYYVCGVNGGSVLSHRGDCTNCWARLESALHRRLEAQDMVEVVLTNRVMIPKGP